MLEERKLGKDEEVSSYAEDMTRLIKKAENLEWPEDGAENTMEVQIEITTLLMNGLPKSFRDALKTEIMTSTNEFISKVRLLRRNEENESRRRRRRSPKQEEKKRGRKQWKELPKRNEDSNIPCKFYNSSGSECTKRNCQFKHACGKCGGKHPSYLCKEEREQDNRVNLGQGGLKESKIRESDVFHISQVNSITGDDRHRIIIPGKINNTKAEITLDTGADTSVIDEDTLRKFNLKLEKTEDPMFIKGIGQKLLITGTVKLNIQIDEKEKEIECFVINQPLMRDILLASKDMRKFSITPIYREGEEVKVTIHYKRGSNSPPTRKL
eukprot:TRINITY_DN5618_c0_g2_i1.p1 TRINITY_DN5618_c0_g2~~TRINITY_DN5618_c0_g2_i1.p1  ORF type:complete len:325 (-),score=59.56 TRINITY_DN5618_c0_g2_i1:252-1226(-)